MPIATNRRAAQEKNFTRQGLSVAEVHHRRGRKSPITNNSETARVAPWKRFCRQRRRQLQRNDVDPPPRKASLYQRPSNAGNR